MTPGRPARTHRTAPAHGRGGVVSGAPATDQTPFAIPRAFDRTLSRIEEDLALDEALLIAAEERGAGPVVRFWEPIETAVVLGASGRLAEDVDLDRCRAEGVRIARRSSGGGTVVVGPGTLNVAVVLPVDAAPGLGAVDEAQRYVLARIADGLRAEGPEVDVRGSGDLTLGDRKFAGSAQRRLRRFFLVHSTLIYDLPLDRIGRLLRPPRRQPAYREGRSHADFLTRIPLPRPALVAAIRRAWGVPTAPPDEPETPVDLVAGLLSEKFDAPGWVDRF